jgi:hypothetical protein
MCVCVCVCMYIYIYTRDLNCSVHVCVFVHRCANYGTRRVCWCMVLTHTHTYTQSYLVFNNILCVLYFRMVTEVFTFCLCLTSGGLVVVVMTGIATWR